MSLRNRLSKEEINREFTHYGRFYGIIPVYIGDPNGETPIIATRNYIPDLFLDVAYSFFDFVTMTIRLVKSDFDPLFFFIVDSKINKDY